MAVPKRNDYKGRCWKCAKTIQPRAGWLFWQKSGRAVLECQACCDVVTLGPRPAAAPRLPYAESVD
jgi:hypothetical protein